MKCAGAEKAKSTRHSTPSVALQLPAVFQPGKRILALAQPIVNNVKYLFVVLCPRLRTTKGRLTVYEHVDELTVGLVRIPD